MTLVQWDVTRGSSQQSSEEKVVMSTGNSPRMNIRAVSQDLVNGIISIFFFLTCFGFLQQRPSSLKYKGSFTSHSTPWSICGLLYGSESGCFQSLREKLWKNLLVLAHNTIRPRGCCESEQMLSPHLEWLDLDQNYSLKSGLYYYWE